MFSYLLSVIIVMLFLLQEEGQHAFEIAIYESNSTFVDSNTPIKFRPYVMKINTNLHSNMDFILDISGKGVAFNCYCKDPPCKYAFANCVPFTSQELVDGYAISGWRFRTLQFYSTLRAYHPNDTTRLIHETPLHWSTELKTSDTRFKTMSFGNIPDQKIRYMDVVYSNSSFFEKTDGIIGLGYSFINGSFYSFLKSNRQSRYVLDFENMKIVTGKVDIEATYGDLNSAFVMALPTIQYNQNLLNDYMENEDFSIEYGPTCEIEELTICGVNLLSNYSGYWTVGVSTLIPGLALPYEYYRMVLEWVDTHFNNIKQGQLLPTLSIRLSGSSTLISIPLEALIEFQPSSKPPYRVLIHNMNEIRDTYYYAGFPIFPDIYLGTEVLKQIGPLLVSYDSQKMGFYINETRQLELKASSAIRNQSCSAIQKCESPLTYYPPMNSCLEPYCGFYLLQVYDPNLKICKISFGVPLTLVFITLLFGFIELIQFGCCYPYLSRPFRLHSSNGVPPVST